MENNDRLVELRLEETMGGEGADLDRIVPVIDMSDFDRREVEIADALWDAAARFGFFQVVNHGIPQDLIDEGFERAVDFFALDTAEKEKLAMPAGTNAGWEYRQQVRPSTGTADNKESYQITIPRMDGLWPDPEVLPEFRERMLVLEKANWDVGMRILRCFARKLGFPLDHFTKAHERDSSEYQCTLRMIHYMAMPPHEPVQPGIWRAGAHTDYTCLSMLHQRVGQGGLQLCPGAEVESGLWTDIEPIEGAITCNIGDMLMRWSDDRLRSTLHRVRLPRAGEYFGPRISLPFFCQANRDVVIESPAGKYAPITAHDYLQQRIAANFAALAASKP